MNGQNLLAVDSFTYLGSTLCKLISRIAKPSVAFGRFHEKVWHRTGIRHQTEGLLSYFFYQPCFYGCETWTVYQRHAKKLNRFYLNCLKKLPKIKWQDRILRADMIMPSHFSDEIPAKMDLSRDQNEDTRILMKLPGPFWELKSEKWKCSTLMWITGKP